VRILVAESLSSFAGIVARIARQWSSEGRGRVDPWFRGLEDASYELRPGVYRYKSADEDELRSDFKRRAWSMLIETRPSNDWEWYFLMQHYGVPTRLLDWTDGALLALYFAVRSSKSDRNVAVWALDPWWLNKNVLGKAEIMQTWEKDVQDYLPQVYDVRSRKRLPGLPIAIEPVHLWRRISAQRSCFTIHGSDRDGLVNAAALGGKRHLVKVVIPRKRVPRVKRELATCGISETTVFPDLEGLSRELTANWAKKPIQPSALVTR